MNQADNLKTPTLLDRIIRFCLEMKVVVFLMVIAFWGAFEQAGGLMNLYAQQKTDRNIFGLFEMTAAQFQFFNPLISIFHYKTITFCFISSKYKISLIFIWFIKDSLDCLSHNILNYSFINRGAGN